jgi:hypothetical protein
MSLIPPVCTLHNTKPWLCQGYLFVGMTGFEPATPSSRTKYATGLRYIPNLRIKNKKDS